MASGSTRSDELLNVGRKVEDPLLITREKPFKLPPSSALGRVRSFLPQLQKANKDLEDRMSSGNQEEWNIENVADEEPFIEMNLALFEDNNSSSDNEMLHTYDSPQSGSESDSDDDIGEVTADNIKLPNQKKGKRPVILEVKTDTNVFDDRDKYHSLNGTQKLSENVQKKDSIHLNSARSEKRKSKRQKGKEQNTKKATKSKRRTQKGRRK